MSSLPIYSLRPAEVFTALESSPAGLDMQEVASRRQLFGDNRLREEAPPRRGRRFVLQIAHPMALLLWTAGLIAMLVGEPLLGAVIWALILVNAGFSLWREYRTEQAMQALRGLLPAYARLVRASAEEMIPADEIVPGDVLVLAEGDNIPADARVVEEFGLRVNNATLTGDPVPARKSADASLQEGISELERPNLVFAGASVVSGTGKAVVYSTGMLTQFGRIAHLTQTARVEPSPLQSELEHLTRRIALVALGIGVLVFVVGAFEVRLGMLESFLLAMGILVAVIPEGLPATVTLSMAMAGQRLAQRGVLVKKLATIETLGAVSTICTDKSGTLTQNQMTVREIWAGGLRYSLSGVGYEPQGAITPYSDSAPGGNALRQDLTELLTAAFLCNNARLNPPTPERPYWTSLGDQTEAALRVAALKGGLQEAALNGAYPRVHELPFDARRKRMSTVHLPGGRPLSSRPEARSEIAFVKGAPREVLQLCSQIQVNGQAQALDEGLRSQILAVNDDYARQALRVLALARRELPPRAGMYTVESVERELVFLGLAAMHDPPRPDVAEAVHTCRQAGIRMIMVTGDYGLTAESLARRVGMLTSPSSLIVTGAELDEMDDGQLQGALAGEVLFARMAPEHKMRLVAALQEGGEVVVVTGDGVNDAPALRKADIGVAMGVIGTDVAKEAADLVLTDDHFASIVSAIEEGRAVYDNVRKFITYIFSSNVPEILPFLLTAALPIPLALRVVQILAIDLGTDMLPALGLGMEKPEPDVMQHPPRRRAQPVVERSLLVRAFLWLGVIEVVLCYSGFFLVYAIAGGAAPWPPQDFLARLAEVTLPVQAELHPELHLLASTVFLAGVVMAQVGNAFACRTEVNRGRALGWLSNRFLLLGVAVEIILILIFIYFPPLAAAMGQVALPARYWLWLGLYAPILYSLDWLRKRLIRTWRTGHDARIR